MYLSEEQKQIIKYVKAGFTNIEIAEELGYSPDTIKKKLCFLYRFFNVKGRANLVTKAIRHSL